MQQIITIYKQYSGQFQIFRKLLIVQEGQRGIRCESAEEGIKRCTMGNQVMKSSELYIADGRTVPVAHLGHSLMRQHCPKTALIQKPFLLTLPQEVFILCSEGHQFGVVRVLRGLLRILIDFAIGEEPGPESGPGGVIELHALDACVIYAVFIVEAIVEAGCGVEDTWHGDGCIAKEIPCHPQSTRVQINKDIQSINQSSMPKQDPQAQQLDSSLKRELDTRQFALAWDHCLNRKQLLLLSCQGVGQLLSLHKLDCSEEALQSIINELLHADGRQAVALVFTKPFSKYHHLLIKGWQKEVGKAAKNHHPRHNKMSVSLQSHQAERKEKSPLKKNISQSSFRFATPQKSLTSTIEDCSPQVFSTDLTLSRTYEEIAHQLQQFADGISSSANLYYRRRCIAFDRLSAVLQPFPIMIYGSCASGIAIDNSDVDVAIAGAFSQAVPNPLQYLQALFRSLPSFKVLKVIPTAKIPILKLSIDTSQPFYYEEEGHLAGPVDVDLTIEAQNAHLGIVSTIKINEWLKEMESLHNIVVVLKQYLMKRGLNVCYKNGLKTYAMILMVVSFIKANKLEKESKGLVLWRMAQFYSQFDEETYGISLMREEIFYRKGKGRYAALEIRDPLDNGKVITNHCYNFPAIKVLFADVAHACRKIERGVAEDQRIDNAFKALMQ